jgi:hypothetical protein
MPKLRGREVSREVVVVVVVVVVIVHFGDKCVTMGETLRIEECARVCDELQRRLLKTMKRRSMCMKRRSMY